MKKTKKASAHQYSVYFGEDLHRCIRVYAAQNDTTISEVLVKAVQEFLNKNVKPMTKKEWLSNDPALWGKQGG